MKEYRVYIVERRGRWLSVNAHDAEEAVERALDAARDDREYEKAKNPFDWDHIEYQDVEAGSTQYRECTFID